MSLQSASALRVELMSDSVDFNVTLTSLDHLIAVFTLAKPFSRFVLNFELVWMNARISGATSVMVMSRGEQPPGLLESWLGGRIPRQL